MSVEKVHQPARIRVADGSAAKPGPAPSKSGPARTKPGNANSTSGTLPAAKPDPKPGFEDIDNGLKDIRSGKLTAGRTRIGDGIREVVKNFKGKDGRVPYAEAKRATDGILLAYSRRPRADIKEVADVVNDYLRAIVIEGLLNAKRLGGGDPLMEALETAKRYVTDGPDRRARTDRLESMIDLLNRADFGRLLTAKIKDECEEAIRSKR